MKHTTLGCWMGLLVGCGSSGPASPAKPAADTGPDSGPAIVDTGPSGSDTGESTPRCPEDMAPVPPEAPVYCIDRYEGSLSDDGQSVVSEAGVVPHVAVTFDEARELCTNTPVVIEGETVGWRRMATLDEWGDAYDGVVGEGGSAYPTGDSWPDDVCALTSETGEQLVDELQPTGSMPDCVGVFGVYDQAGNAWEWADPEKEIDIENFLERIAEGGLILTVDEAGQITSNSDELDNLRLEVPGLTGTLGVTDSGVVVATDVQYQAELPFDFKGYILAQASSAAGSRSALLPVRVAQPEEGSRETEQAGLEMLWSEDGAPITAKVGCAYYSGAPDGCSAASAFNGHPHDFRGTIAVRCAADPIF